jgi:sugar phosphate isomerase/epimerase
MLIKDFSVQLYSLRHEIEKAGFADVLEKVAAIGYTGVEFAGYGGLTADEMLSLLRKNNIKPVGAHIGLERLEEAFDEEAAYHKTLGTPTLTVPSADFSKEGFSETCSRLLSMAKRVKAAGFGFSYHNHAEEFAPGTEGYLIEDIPRDIDLQLDLYWASKAGCDCEAFIRKHAPRVTSLHIKQMDAAGKSCDLGDGVIDFSLLIQTGLQHGAATFIHEQESFSGCAFDCLANGYKHIMSL